MPQFSARGLCCSHSESGHICQRASRILQSSVSGKWSKSYVKVDSDPVVVLLFALATGTSFQRAHLFWQSCVLCLDVAFKRTDKIGLIFGET